MRFGRLVTSVAVPLISLAGMLAASAQTYPNHPIQLTVPFSTGHQIDVSARVFADGLSTALGQPVVVMNREGAAGIIAYGTVARAQPDGYTLLFGAQGQLTIQPHLNAKLPYKLSDFEPICEVFENTFVILVADKSPIKSLADLIAQAKAKPGMRWGGSGVGTVSQIQTAGLAKDAGIETVFTPYRNFAQLFGDLEGGLLDFAATGLSTFPPGVRPIAMLADARSKAYPDVPTVVELGYRVSMPGFGGMYAPKGTPAPVLDRLEAACKTAFEAPAYQAMAAKTYSSSPFLGRAAFTKRLQADYRDKEQLIHALGIKIE
jgi:tripartite-type tricarboxylate transporter receptor subunit TctC